MQKLPFDNAMYLRHQYMVHMIAVSFEKTTKIDAYELECAAWDKFNYARQFFPDSGVTEKAFVRQVAKTAMIDYSNKCKKHNVPTVSLDAMLDTSEDNPEQAAGTLIINHLSVTDDQIIADLSITVSQKALDLCKAIVNENIKTKTDCQEWGKAHGLTRTSVNFLMFEIALALQGKKMTK